MARADDLAKTVMQVVAIGMGALILSMVFHKAYADISPLAERFSGGRFWLELARYFIANIAGG
jgi:hypothetical protein